MAAAVWIAVAVLATGSAGPSRGLLERRLPIFTAPALVQDEEETPEEPPPTYLGFEWTGGVSAGVSVQRGNTKSQTASASADVEGNRNQTRLISGLSYIGGRTENRDRTSVNFRDKETTARQFTATSKMDYFLNEARTIYTYANGLATTDGVRRLRLLWSAGFGAGYQWLDKEKASFFGLAERQQSFRTEIGIAYTEEDYRNSAADEEYLAGRAAVRYDIKISDNASAYSEVEWAPSLEDIDEDQLYRSKSVLRTNISGNLNAEFTVLFDLDTSPAPGFGRRDVSYVFGLNWSF